MVMPRGAGAQWRRCHGIVSAARDALGAAGPGIHAAKFARVASPVNWRARRPPFA